MTRTEFAQDMKDKLYQLKIGFFSEYWSETCCLKKEEENKIQNAIRKISNVLDGMKDDKE